MTSLRQTFGCPLPVSLVVVLMVGVMFTALAAPAFAGSKHLLTFKYDCLGGEVFNRAEIDDITTTLKLSGAPNDSDEFCQKFLPPGSIDFAECEARRTAMRSVIESAANGDCQMTDDDGQLAFPTATLQVLCTSDEKEVLLTVLGDACEQLHSLGETP